MKTKNLGFILLLVLSASTTTIFYILITDANSHDSNSTSRTHFNINTLFNSECECRKGEAIFLTNHESHLAVNSFDQIRNTTRNLFNISIDEFQNLTLTCDMYAFFRRGKSQKVISYSLYGTNTFYYDKLKDIVKQMKSLYPDWSMRVFHDNSINRTIKCQIECLKDDESNEFYDRVDFCNIENEIRSKPKVLVNALNETTILSFIQHNLSYIHAMKWRFLPIGDSFVDVFSSRDTDSYLLQREVDSVNVWLNSDEKGHIMRGN